MQNLLAQKCSTFSKRPDQHVFNWPQIYHGATYQTDWVCGLGSNLYGWENNFSCHDYREFELAEKLLAIIPFCNRIKFLKTGSAACEAAVRIARAHTGRKKVIGQGYHGCANIFIAAESPGLGCVDEGYFKVQDDAVLLKTIDSETAAVIVEPVQLEWSANRQVFLSSLRKNCSDCGAMLIFDEVITGFRVPDFFVSNTWKVYPDILCGGKGLGNGYPLAFVAGDSTWMDKEYFISNTHNGELSGIVAALKTIATVSKDVIRKAWIDGGALKDTINGIVNPNGFGIEGYSTRGEWQGHMESFAKYCELMADAGHLVGKAWFYNFALIHSRVESFVTESRKAVKNITEGYKLRGYVPQPIFKRN